MLRADREYVAPLKHGLRQECRRLLEHVLPHCHVTVLSDYAKGVLADGLAAELIAAARAAGHRLIVDPKGTDYSAYRGASVIKPNRRELGGGTKPAGESRAQIVDAARARSGDHRFGA